MGGKSGGKKGVCMGGKMACCVLGGRKKREERKKKNKRKNWPAAHGWLGEKENRGLLLRRERKQREKKKIAPLCTWLGAWRGKKYIYRRPAIWGAWPAREKKYIAGQMVVWPAREKIIIKWNSKF
jgi:hypothetical protein